MKKLTKQTLDELEKVMPVLSEKDQRFIVACGNETPVTGYYSWVDYNSLSVSGSWNGGYVMTSSGNYEYYPREFTINEVFSTSDKAYFLAENFYIWASLNSYLGLDNYAMYEQYLMQGESGNFNSELYVGGYIPDEPKGDVKVDLAKGKNSCFVGYNISRDCMVGCKAMMKNLGVTPLHKDFRVEFVDKYLNNSYRPNDKTSVGYSIIDFNLDQGKPVIAGVRNLAKPDTNVEGQYANHFIIISGCGTDVYGQKYYSYIDSGQTNASEGINSDNNRLTLNSEGFWVDKTLYNRDYTYILTEVRGNK